MLDATWTKANHKSLIDALKPEDVTAFVKQVKTGNKNSSTAYTFKHTDPAQPEVLVYSNELSEEFRIQIAQRLLQQKEQTHKAPTNKTAPEVRDKIFGMHAFI